MAPTHSGAAGAHGGGSKAETALADPLGRSGTGGLRVERDRPVALSYAPPQAAVVTESVAAANGCLGMGGDRQVALRGLTAVLRQCGASGRAEDLWSAAAGVRR